METTATETLRVSVSKGRDGWQAETRIHLEAPFIIEISTHKTSRGIVSTATRAKLDGVCISMDLFGDFRERKAYPTDRCTEKTVKARHMEMLADLDGIKARCAAHYANKRKD